MSKRNDMNALVAKLVRSTGTPTEPVKPVEADEAGERNTPTTGTHREYKRKPETEPRKEISKELIEEFELTPEMVKAINKIRERDRTAREKDTRTSPTYGLQEGYKRHTLAFNVNQLETLKDIAKKEGKTFYIFIEEILNEYINSYDNNK